MFNLRYGYMAGLAVSANESHSLCQDILNCTGRLNKVYGSITDKSLVLLRVEEWPIAVSDEG